MPYCPECGEKIDLEKIKKDEKKHEEKEHHETKHKKWKKSKWIKLASITGGLLILSAIFIFAIPLPYHPTEVYSVSEPYTDSETYYEQESYQDRECEYRRASYNDEQDMERVGDKVKVICTITNFENEPVEFQYKLYTTVCQVFF